MSAPNETPAEDLRNALQLLTGLGRHLDALNGNDDLAIRISVQQHVTVSELSLYVESACTRVTAAVHKLEAPSAPKVRDKHPLTPRHIDGLRAIARAASGLLGDAALRRAIGRYATNVIASLEVDRKLIAWQVPLEDGGAGGWLLTERGHAMIQALADERRSA